MASHSWENIIKLLNVTEIRQVKFAKFLDLAVGKLYSLLFSSPLFSSPLLSSPLLSYLRLQKAGST
jgi:hypothetical protein